MKRKSKSLITGGLLGLAGLGLLLQEAEASTHLPAVVPDLSLGEALAENPSPVIAPEPSAQATVPQVDEPQPAWSPESGQSEVAIAGAKPAIAPAEAANVPAADVVIAPQVAPSLEDNIAISPTAAVVENPPQEAITPPAELLPELSPQPETVKPPLPTAELSKPVAAPAIMASPRREIAPRAVAPATVIAPNPALTASANPPANSAPTPTSTNRPDAPDLATLRARGTAVQALMRDLRATAGLNENALTNPAPSRLVSQGQGPQLPQLPSSSARRRPTFELTSNRATSPAALLSTAGATQDGQPGLRSGPQRPLQLSPQLPGASARAIDVALALPAAQPVMSPAPAEAISLPPISPTAPAAIAQASPAAEAAQIRDDLQIAPLTTTANPRRTFGPSPNAGIPSGFGANGGDVFASVSLSGADRLRPEADGSLSVGFGLGDSRQVVGFELAYNLLSVRRFGENGSFDAKIHRQVYSSDETEVAAAVGLNNFASYGSNTVDTPSSLYGVVTAAHLLQPDHPFNRMPITGTLGLGGGNFSGEGSDVGVIAGVGLQVHPQFSVNTAWSGVGLNVGASIVPVPTVPLTVNLLYGDIGNNTQAGSVAVLSIGYGFNFGPQF